MNKPYDATLNDLIGARLDDWAAYFARLAGIPPGPAESLDTDLATTVQADRVFRINGAAPALLHLELEANPRLGVPRELMRYNTLIDHQYDLPVETVLILLRPKAEASDQNGLYVRTGVTGGIIAQFRYRVERVWQRSVEDWLRAGSGLSPLALLTDEADADLEPALGRFKERLFDRTTSPELRRSILGSSYVLCGLRYDVEQVADMYRRLSMTMEDSTTYQDILAKGVAQGAVRTLRATILRLGTKKFGAPAAATVAAVEQLTDVARLQELSDRLLDVSRWDELLAGV